MSTLTELVSQSTHLSQRDLDRVHRLLGSWQLIADLSFADLLLWCRDAGEQGFVCVGQMRPYTAQTMRPEDVFGMTLRAEEIPVVDRAYHEGTSWRREDPLLIDGIPVQMEAIPVRFGHRVIAVLTKEGAPLGHRRPGRLELNYLECGEALSKMVEEGTFPFAGETLDPELSPRVGDGMIRVDTAGRVLYASPNAISAYRRLGISSNLEGELLSDLEVDPSALKYTLAVGMPAEGDVEVDSTVVLQRAIPFLEGEERKITGALLLIRDVTELRHRERQLQRKEAVIREVHHRVKNNLQTIASLLRLQARRLGTSEAKAALEEAVRRIASIAVVHETLSKQTSESVEFAEVARVIAAMVRDGLTDPEKNIEIDLVGSPGSLPADIATPLSVVLVELLQNAVEHGFGHEGGTVSVSMKREGDRLYLSVSDTGKGLPKEFTLENAGLGLQIVRELVETELGGSIELYGAEGTRAELEVPARRRTGLRP